MRTPCMEGSDEAMKSMNIIIRMLPRSPIHISLPLSLSLADAAAGRDLLQQIDTRCIPRCFMENKGMY